MSIHSSLDEARPSALARACAAAFVAFATGLSQSQPLEPVVVTATRTATPVDRVLADVTVIDSDAIARAGTASLPELLRTAGGIEVSQTGGPGTVAGVFIRGTRHSQTLFLIDGVRLENPTSGGALPEYLPLSQIERIEIVRGPASSLYGSGAIGGVVQIFTRQAESDGLSPYASAEVGSRGTRRLQGGLNGRAGDSSFSLSLSDERSDGYDITRPTSPDHQDDRDGYDMRSASASLRHRLSGDWRVGANLLVNDGEVDLDFGCSEFSCPSPELSRAEFRTTTASAFLTGELTKGWETTMRVGNTAIDYDYPAFGSTARTDSRTYSWQNTVTAAGARWLFGVESIEQTIDGEGLTRGDQVYEQDSRDTDSVFGGWERDFGAHQLRLALRRDRIEQVGSETSGSVNWGWQLDSNWLLRAGWGSAFRAPTFDDLYNPWGANPDLKPERSRSIEVAAEWRRRHDLFKATAFSSRIRDAIELDANFVPQNLETSTVKGITFEGRRQWGALALRGSLTFQDPEGERVDPATSLVTRAQLARRARRFASVGADWQEGAWRVSANLIAQGKRVDTNGAQMGGYAYLDLSADYRIDRRWQVFARLSNVSDRDFETAWGYRSVPRTLLVGVRFHER